MQEIFKYSDTLDVAPSGTFFSRYIYICVYIYIYIHINLKDKQKVVHI